MYYDTNTNYLNKTFYIFLHIVKFITLKLNIYLGKFPFDNLKALERFKRKS